MVILLQIRKDEQKEKKHARKRTAISHKRIQQKWKRVSSSFCYDCRRQSREEKAPFE
jgi:hypothetical protein